MLAITTQLAGCHSILPLESYCRTSEISGNSYAGPITSTSPSFWWGDKIALTIFADPPDDFTGCGGIVGNIKSFDKKGSPRDYFTFSGTWDGDSKEGKISIINWSGNIFARADISIPAGTTPMNFSVGTEFFKAHAKQLVLVALPQP
jgi:hypothetical protein